MTLNLYMTRESLISYLSSEVIW